MEFSLAVMCRLRFTSVFDDMDRQGATRHVGEDYMEERPTWKKDQHGRKTEMEERPTWKKDRDV